MTSTHPTSCGCCEGAAPLTPLAVQNRPGLPAIAYRVGTYRSFVQTMVDEISSVAYLSRWSTRSLDDDGITLLNLWALVADILTFYQERIANESFVRTAVWRESLMRLVRLLDYTPSPGLAATADLAFTVEPGKSVALPVGLKVQSVPGQGQKPQKFEISTSLLADALVNVLRIFPVPMGINPFAQGTSEATALGAAPPIPPGTKLALFDHLHLEAKVVAGTKIRDTQVVVDWSPPVLENVFTPLTSYLAPYKRVLRLFGYNAPDYLDHIVADLNTTPPSGKWQHDVFDFKFDPSQRAVYLDSRYDDIKPGARVLLAIPGGVRMSTVTATSSEHQGLGVISDTVTKLTLELGALDGRRTVMYDPTAAHRWLTIADDSALWLFGKGSWHSLGGRFTTLAAAADRTNKLHIFALGTDGATWHAHEKSSMLFDSWTRLDGSASDLLATTNKDGSLLLLARGTDDALWVTTQHADGSWAAWTSLGGDVRDMAVASNKDGTVEAFTVGPDGTISRIAQSLPLLGWGSWATIPGRRFDLVAAASERDGRLEVFGSNSTGVWHSHQLTPGGSWSDWETLGGAQMVSLTAGLFPGSPGAGWPFGTIQVFGVDAAGNSWHISQQAANGAWRQWDTTANTQDAATQVSATVTPYYITATQRTRSGTIQILDIGFPPVTLPPPIWSVADRRIIQVYELSGPPLKVWNLGFPSTITGNSFCVLGQAPAALAPGRALLVDDAAGQPQLTKVMSAQGVDITGKGTIDATVLTIADDLTRPLDTWSAVLYGNVVPATHGVTVASEVIGSGDGSAAFQTFELSKSPVTHVADPSAPGGAADTVHVSVSGVAWTQANTLYGRGGDEAIFTTAVGPDGSESVGFGDGVNGARLATGQGNVVATYRQGLGPDGNVPRLSVTTLLDKPLGLKSVTNPGPAYGGADAAAPSDIRDAAPASVRTFDRVIALQDFETAALGYAGVTRALAQTVWDGDDESVHLTVLGAGGNPLSVQVKGQLAAYLDDRRDPNRKLVLEDATQVPIHVAASISPMPGQTASQVVAAAQAALAAGLSFDRLNVGQPIRLSEVYALLQNVPGVLSAEVTLLDYKNPADRQKHGTGPGPVQPALPIYPNEIAQLVDPSTDAVITLGGGQ